VKPNRNNSQRIFKKWKSCNQESQSDPFYLLSNLPIKQRPLFISQLKHFHLKRLHFFTQWHHLALQRPHLPLKRHLIPLQLTDKTSLSIVLAEILTDQPLKLRGWRVKLTDQPSQLTGWIEKSTYQVSQLSLRVLQKRRFYTIQEVIIQGF
jgi:hypothetical protein